MAIVSRTAPPSGGIDDVVGSGGGRAVSMSAKQFELRHEAIGGTLRGIRK